ncbi:hypothetical protein [Oerskovia turbata]
MGDDAVDGAEDDATLEPGLDDGVDHRAMSAPDLASAYVRHLLDGSGDRAARLRAIASVGAQDEVFRRLRDDPDPMALIDAIAACDQAVEVVHVLGAGVMEDFLQWRPEFWHQVDDRCSGDATWAQMASGVWLPDAICEQLPPRLRALAPSVLAPEESSRRGRRRREKAERKARARKSGNGRTEPRRFEGMSVPDDRDDGRG